MLYKISSNSEVVRLKDYRKDLLNHKSAFAQLEWHDHFIAIIFLKFILISYLINGYRVLIIDYSLKQRINKK